MFCPKCKAEYREGFDRCADCNIPLVEKLPEKKAETREKNEKRFRFVKLLATADPALAGFMKSLLEAEGIIHTVVGGHIDHGGGSAAEIRVWEEDYERANRLLSEIEWSEKKIW
jgi:hypothetical protein